MEPRCKVITDLLESKGCEVEEIQPEDGNGYTVIMVSVPGVGDIEVTVNE